MTEWMGYCCLIFMVGAYFVLEGMELGTSMLQFAVARGEKERTLLRERRGKLWGGNELWLLGACGITYVLFPRLYQSFSAGMFWAIVLGGSLLAIKVIGVELRAMWESVKWHRAWDLVITFSSIILGLLFAVALGNMIRGFSFSGEALHTLPLFTTADPFAPFGVFDVFTLSTGIVGLSFFVMQGACWMRVHITYVWVERVKPWFWLCWGIVGLGIPLLLWASLKLQPLASEHLVGRPWLQAFPALCLALWLLLGAAFHTRRHQVAVALCGFFLFTLLVAVFATLFPLIMPPARGLSAGVSIWDGLKSVGLKEVLWWFAPIASLIVTYVIVISRQNNSLESH